MKTLGWFNDFHKTRIKLSNRQIWRLLSTGIVKSSKKQTTSSDFIAKEIFVLLQEHYKETKFRWIRKEVVLTVPYWKWRQILLT